MAVDEYLQSFLTSALVWVKIVRCRPLYPQGVRPCHQLDETQNWSGRFGVFSSCCDRQHIFEEGMTRPGGRIVWEMKKYCIESSGERNILHTIKRRKANNIGHILCTNFLLKHFIENNKERRIEGKRRWGRRRKHLLDSVKKENKYWNFREEALDLTIRRTRFGRGYWPILGQTAGWWWGNTYSVSEGKWIAVGCHTTKNKTYCSL